MTPELSRQNEPPSLYVHIPFCRSKCGYCAFYSEPLTDHDTSAFISALIAEMDLCKIPTPVSTVYIGGGSPSAIPPEDLLRLIKEIKNRYQFQDEFTVELNPAQTTAELFKKLYDSGVNRISLGAQSFNQNELDFLGRAHTVADIENAVINARKAALHNLSIDLIFAIPGSRDDSFLRSLRSALYLGPQHISAYSLTYEQNTPLKSDVDAGKIKPVDEETDRTQYTLAIDELAKAGFEQYEISNFARGGFECRHNLNCWENKPYIGLGPAAASWFQGKRYTNIPNVTEYIKSIKNGKHPACDIQKLTPEQIACETAVLNLRRTKGIDLNEFTERTGYNAIQLFSSSITKNLQLKLIRMISGRIELTKKALPIADSVLCDFASPD